MKSVVEAAEAAALLGVSKQELLRLIFDRKIPPPQKVYGWSKDEFVKIGEVKCGPMKKNAN